MKRQKRQLQGKEIPKVMKKRGIPQTSDEWEKHYEELASFYESDESLDMIAQGVPMPTAKLRSLSKQKAKLISIRIPAIDLVGIKRIAAKKDEPYQRVIIQAVEKLIDEEEQKELAEQQIRKVANS